MNGSVELGVAVAAAEHELRVSMTVAGAAHDGVLRVESPTWVPGDYEFQAFGRDVFGVKAIDAGTGAPLRVRRRGWQGYEIEGADAAVQLSYTAYCSSWDFSEACGILGDTGGVLTGARYLRVAGYDGEYTVAYELPPGWAVHHPSGALQVAPTSWRYPSYEILLDTPVCVGAFELLTHDVDGTPFHYVFLDRTTGSGSQSDAFATQVDAVARTFREQFGSFPFADYTFVASVNPNAEWGLEHLTSTMVGLGPDVFTDPDQHAVGVRVCAHELFHAWNVRRLRPATLGALDLTHGSFTEGLWVAEGFTRYYEFLSCTRTGVYTAQQFLSAVVNYYRHLVALDAYRRVSPIDASLASFLNHDAKYPGRVNDAIDYYDAGLVIAFGIDASLRSRTPGASLDKAFAAFYERYVGQGDGYTPEQLRDFLDDIEAGVGTHAFREASEPGALALVDHLQLLGFAVATEPVPYLGLVFLDDGVPADGPPAIYGVLDRSPAGASGVAPEDVITAVDGFPFELAALRWAVRHQPGVRIAVLRGNAARSYDLEVGTREEIVGVTWAGSAAQAERIAAWTGQPFAPAPGDAMPLDFYENFHGVETVI